RSRLGRRIRLPLEVDFHRSSKSRKRLSAPPRPSSIHACVCLVCHNERTVPSVQMKTVLVRSLCTMVSEKKRRKARQFLLGLSTDELQYLAEFLGSCILESEHPYQWTRDQLNQGIQRFDRGQKHSLS